MRAAILVALAGLLGAPVSLAQHAGGASGSRAMEAPVERQITRSRSGHILLTQTSGRKYQGLQGPRHWLRSSPEGDRIAFLMKDDAGVVQLWTVSPHGGEISQLSGNAFSIGSPFTWSPDGRFIAHLMDNSVCITSAKTGRTTRLTQRTEDATAPRPEACVVSPDGRRVAYVRPVGDSGKFYNQIFVVELGKNSP